MDASTNVISYRLGGFNVHVCRMLLQWMRMWMWMYIMELRPRQGTLHPFGGVWVRAHACTICRYLCGALVMHVPFPSLATLSSFLLSLFPLCEARRELGTNKRLASFLGSFVVYKRRAVATPSCFSFLSPFCSL